MIPIVVDILGKDRRVGAMVKALAVEVSGFTAVTGTTRDFLIANGFYVFHFPTQEKANDFSDSVAKYLSGKASVRESQKSN